MSHTVSMISTGPTKWADEALLLPASVLIALVWLLPNHHVPWLAFHHDVAMAAVIALMAIVIGWQTRWDMRIPWVAVGVVFLALVPFAQYVGGLLPKHGIALTGSLYLVVFFAAIVIGCSSQAAKTNIFWRLIFSSIALAALLNVAIQLIQWRGSYNSDFLSLVGFWISKAADHNRPSGSLLQPNLLATLLVWGAIAILWLHRVRQVRLWLTLIALIPLGFGIALTQSRAGMLEILVLLPLSILVLPASQRKKNFLIILCFAAAVITSVFLMPAVVNAWSGAEAIRPRDISMAQDRLAIFKIFAYALTQSPWQGFGFGNLGTAFLIAATDHPEWYFGGFALHTHNLFLDYLLWFGLPLGIALIMISLWVFKNAVSYAKLTEDGFFFLAMVTVLGVHSMVELPHQYLYFLAPAGLFLGYLSKPVAAVKTGFRSQKAIWVGAGSVGLFFSAVITVEYLTVQARYTEWRFENERIGTKLGLHADGLVFLQHFADELSLYNTKFDRTLDLQTQEWVLDTVQASNSAPAYFNVAVMLALNGREADALVWMHRLNAISNRDAWVTIDRLWRERQRHHPELSGLEWPALSDRISY